VVSPSEEGWKVIGLEGKKIYKTKNSAVKAAKGIARLERKPLIIHSRDGKVSSVNSYRRTIATGRIMSANGHRKLSNERVRNIVAEVLLEKGKR